MDVVAFPPPPTPFLDDDFNFGDFTFASASAAPQPPMADPHPATFAAFDDDWGNFVASPLGSNPDASAPPTPPMAKSNAWQKLWGSLPLSLFGADDDDDGQEEEGPTKPSPMATAHQRAPSFSSNRSKPTNLKDLITSLYESRPPSTPDVVEAGTPEADDDDGFRDDGWEFKARARPPQRLRLRFGHISEAYRVFDEMPERDVVTWNAMVFGLCRNARAVESRGHRHVVSLHLIVIRGLLQCQLL